MKNKILKIAIGCCAFFFCAASVFAQNFEVIKPNGNKPLAQPLISDTSCEYMFASSRQKPASPQEYKGQYDTLRLYIQKCAASDDQSYSVFTTMTSAVQSYSMDTTRFDSYRNWLIPVIYLNTTSPEYFCECLGAIMETYQYGKYKAIGYLAVEDFMRKFHPECTAGYDINKQYTKDSLDLVRAGYDAAHLPPLDSLGLGFLLKAGVTSSSSPLPSQYLASFTSSPNPFNKETTLEFTLNRMTYTTIAVYDELGRLVWGDGTGSSLEAGEHLVHLDASNFPSGTLYARISTGFGEVKTVKLIHEK